MGLGTPFKPPVSSGKFEDASAMLRGLLLQVRHLEPGVHALCGLQQEPNTDSRAGRNVPLPLLHWQAGSEP